MDSMPPEAVADSIMDDMHFRVFQLFNRDRSGYADEADVIAALQCQFRSDDLAAQALARICEEGHIDAAKLRRLIEGIIPEVDLAARHRRTVRLLLTMVKDFERRTTERGEYVLASQARACVEAMRAMEEERALSVMQRQQQQEREVLMHQQTIEASEFNRAWRQRMDEFSKIAANAIEEMRARHENSVEEFLATNRPQLIDHCRRHAKDKDTLDSECVLHHLAKTSEYTTLEKYAKHVQGKVAKEHDAAVEKAEEELQKKLEVHRWHMRLELRGLVTKCERIRSEHRGQWEDGLAKLILAQKTKIADVKARHAREYKKMGETIRASLEPGTRPKQRVDTRRNLSLLSPRRPPTAASALSQWPPAVPHPPPTQRPSRVSSARPVSSGATCPPRPYTSEHVPKRALLSPRVITSAR